MKDKIIDYIDKGRFEELVEYIIDNKKLNSKEKLILIILFNQAKSKLSNLKFIAEKASLSKNEVKKILDNLIKNKWCKQEILDENSRKTAYYLRLPDYFTNDNSFCKQKGSKIAKNWSEIFGTRQLTPTNLEKFISFIEDGIEEDVIIEVMKLSAEKAEGNSVNYALNVLHNFLKRKILTWEDFENERSERKKYDRQIQKNNRAKEKRKELHDIKELEKRGWND